jgi:hypothetical protein
MDSYMDFDDSKIRLIRITRLHASESDSTGRTDLSKLTNTLSSLLLSFLFFSFPFLILTEMRPLFDGTSGHVGFVRGHGCYRKACYNEEGSDPENLGNDIIDFIISHTAQELEELKGIVDKVSPLSNTLIYPILKHQLEWVSWDRVEKMSPADRQRFHITPLPTRRWYLTPIDHTGPRTVEEFRIANPDFPSNIEDSEIKLRYLPRRPYFQCADHLEWIPEYEEIVQFVDRRNLLERICNGCERYLIHDSYDHDPPNWKYMIDLENRTLKMEGVFEHKTTFSFDELQKGMFDGWREENDPSESWMTDPDVEEEEKLSARKGLAAGMGPKDGDQDEREKKRPRLDIGTGREGPGAGSRTKAWLKLIWENASEEDSDQVGEATP